MEKINEFNEMMPEGLNTLMNKGRDIVLVNVLPLEVYGRKHLPGSINICVFEATFSDQIEAMITDKDREIVLYGSSDRSKDAVAAAEKLMRMGYQKVSVLVGGIAAWQTAGFALEGTDTKSHDDTQPQLRFKDGTYVVDREKSGIEWIGRNPNTAHFGTLAVQSGRITVTDGLIGGTFDIDMQSIKNNSLEGDEMQPVLIDRLESDDFFFVRMFPKATFTIKKARPLDEPTLTAPNFEFMGSFELRGLTRKVEFPATVNLLMDNTIGIEAHFDIDRTRWGIIYGSSRFFEHLGMHLVFDLVSIQLRIVAIIN